MIEVSIAQRIPVKGKTRVRRFNLWRPVDWSGRHRLLENAFAFPSCGVVSMKRIQSPVGLALQARPRKASFLSGNQQTPFIRHTKNGPGGFFARFFLLISRIYYPHNVDRGVDQLKKTPWDHSKGVPFNKKEQPHFSYRRTLHLK